MDTPRITVQHWVIARTVRTYGTVFTEADLLGVTPDYTVPPDTEFPKERRNVPHYLRFVAESAGVTEFLVRTHYQRRPDEWELTSESDDGGRPIVLPDDRVVDWVEVIRAPYLLLHGVGLYAVTIFFRSAEDDERADPDETPWDPAESGWVFGAVDYFRVSTS